MNKYYTPEIEEFHVGFEYESLGMISTVDGSNPKRWKKGYNKILPTNLEQLIRGGKIRVKYLDREDIESLGFKHERLATYVYKHYSLFRVGVGNIIEIQKDGEVIFYGKIKNKSELKRLLTQLNIL